MKRGATWSYVIRVKDTETGISKPQWVGGYATEEEAKAARDEARVKAHRGEYIDRNRITVTAYLDDWIDSHAMEIKPRTLHDYRSCIRLYVTPRIGHLPSRPCARPHHKALSRLLTSGGRDGKPLAVATVTHLHAVLRKAFRDAVIVDELISSNPVERAKRPRAQARRARHRLDGRPSSGRSSPPPAAPAVRLLHVAAYTGARRGELLNLRWPDVDLEAKRLTISGSTAVIAGERIDGTTKSGRTRVVSHRRRTPWPCCASTSARPRSGSRRADWRGVKTATCSRTGWGGPIYPDTVTSLMAKLIRAHNQPSSPDPRTSSRTPGYMICATSTPQPCCWPASRFMSSPPAWATLTRPSPSGCTPTSSATSSRRRGHLRQGHEGRELAAVSIRVSKKAPSLIGRGL